MSILDGESAGGDRLQHLLDIVDAKMCVGGIIVDKSEEGEGAVCILRQDVRTLLVFFDAEDTEVVAQID